MSGAGRPIGPHAVCPGSFDPPTNGHLDVIARAARLFPRVTVAVLVNPDKQGLFEVAERVELLAGLTAGLPGVAVDSFAGLLVDYCAQIGATAVVKGIRGAADVGYEVQMAQMNAALTAGSATQVETVLLASAPALAFVSSSLVKQIAQRGGDVGPFLPGPVLAALTARGVGRR